jgi:hypothetical protein
VTSQSCAWVPGIQKTAGNEKKNVTIANCTVVANGAPGDIFIIEHFYRRHPAYLRNIRQS